VRDFLLEIATEITSALFARVSAISSRHREERARKQIEADLAELRKAAVEAERKFAELEKRIEDAGI